MNASGFEDCDNQMYVIRHNNGNIYFDIVIMLWDICYLTFRNFPVFIEPHSPVHNITKQEFAVNCTNSYEITTGM